MLSLVSSLYPHMKSFRKYSVQLSQRFLAVAITVIIERLLKYLGLQ
mgnify:CR=1